MNQYLIVESFIRLNGYFNIYYDHDQQLQKCRDKWSQYHETLVFFYLLLFQLIIRNTIIIQNTFVISNYAESSNNLVPIRIRELESQRVGGHRHLMNLIRAGSRSNRWRHVLLGQANDPLRLGGTLHFRLRVHETLAIATKLVSDNHFLNILWVLAAHVR